MDILLLEDDRKSQVDITSQIPESFITKTVGNSVEFRQYLEAGGKARLYLLDDEVPENYGKPTGRFIYHSGILLKRMPDSKIVYIGCPFYDSVEKYCESHGIPIIGKDRVGEFVKKNLII